MRPRASIIAAVVLIGLSAAGCRRGGGVPTVAIYNLLSHPILDQSVAGIKAGLAAAGYGEGTVRIVEVNANGEMDKLAAFAQEVLHARPDVVVPVSTPVAQAVWNAASPSQQIVFSTVTNPADIGAPADAANLTGVSDAVNYDASIALIFELFPRTRTIGMVYNPGERNSQFGVERVRQIAATRGFELKLATVGRSDEVADAARALAAQVDVFYVGSDNTVVSALAALLGVAAERRTPVMASDAGSLAEGAVAAVSVDYELLGRRVGAIVAEILRTRRNAGTIPREQFLGDRLLLNRTAAQRFGVTFPDSVVARAAQVLP